ETWPGRKQVWRARDAEGIMREDVVSLEDDRQSGETLIAPVMRGGKRLAPSPRLAEIRAHAARNLEHLPEPLKRLEQNYDYPVRISDRLKALAAEIDRKSHR